MRTSIQISKNYKPQKNTKDFYTNYHLALRLYYIYKSEAVPKREPKLPVSDWRRPVSKPHYRLFILKNIRHFSADIFSPRKVFDRLSSQLNFSRINFLNK
jgi:hypothetical protein